MNPFVSFENCLAVLYLRARQSKKISVSLHSQSSDFFIHAVNFSVELFESFESFASSMRLPFVTETARRLALRLERRAAVLACCRCSYLIVSVRQ